MDTALDSFTDVHTVLIDLIYRHEIDTPHYPELLEAQVTEDGNKISALAGLAERVLQDTIQAMDDLSDSASQVESQLGRTLRNMPRDVLLSTDSTRVNLGDTLQIRAGALADTQGSDTSALRQTRCKGLHLSGF